MENRKQLQFRLGVKLIQNIDTAIEWLAREPWETDIPENRTDFVLAAINARLEDSTPRLCGATADVLFGSRQPFMVRVPRETMEAIDADAAELEVSRTNWVIDAILLEIHRLAKTIPHLREYPYRVCDGPSDQIVRETE